MNLRVICKLCVMLQSSLRLLKPDIMEKVHAFRSAAGLL
jgi:hypothetical protein